jgi:hypothetical protein
LRGADGQKSVARAGVVFGGKEALEVNLTAAYSEAAV